MKGLFELLLGVFFLVIGAGTTLNSQIEQANTIVTYQDNSFLGKVRDFLGVVHSNEDHAHLVYASHDLQYVFIGGFIFVLLGAMLLTFRISVMSKAKNTEVEYE